MLALGRIEPAKPYTSLDSAQSSAPSKGVQLQAARYLTFGGADRDRTGDPLLAKQVLSQLSYSPIWQLQYGGPG